MVTNQLQQGRTPTAHDMMKSPCPDLMGIRAPLAINRRRACLPIKSAAEDQTGQMWMTGLKGFFAPKVFLKLTGRLTLRRPTARRQFPIPQSPIPKYRRRWIGSSC
ncbi:MAG TPA: hypothetical protein VL985_15845, partial [Stellaceae bacterium]|nr:hypothetical protein [Stellaceae bacterium]